MLAVVAFWAGLWLPGLWAVLRWTAKEERGPLTLVAKGYLASFALLTPVSILGYLLSLPLSVLSLAVVALVLVGACLLARRAWLAPRRLGWPGSVAVLGLLLVLADAYLAAASGGHLGGDAGYHIARVRLLLNHDFTNGEPLIDPSRFDSIYHTNLYHALMACCAQLTGRDPVEVWVHTLAFGKLVAASASAELAWVMINRRWAAWMAAVTTTIWTGPVSTFVYPNMLTAYWLSMLAAAIVIEVLSRPASARSVVALAAIAVVIPQVHGLYYVFLVLLAGPALLWVAVRASLQRRQVVLRWACLAILFLGMPWPVMSAGGRLLRMLRPVAAAQAQAEAQEAKPPAAEPEPIEVPSGFVRVGEDWFMLDPSAFVDVQNARFQLVLALALCLLFGPRERRWAIAAVFGTLGFLLLVPPVCTLLSAALGAPWMVQRLAALLSIAYFALFPSSLALLLPGRWKEPWLRPVQVAALLAAAYVANERGVDKNPWLRDRYIERALEPDASGRRARRVAERARFLSRHVPSGATVWTPLDRDYRTPMQCDCQVLATKPLHGTRGLGAAMQERREAHAALISPTTAPARRAELLERYGIRHFVVEWRLARQIMRIYRPAVVGIHRLNRLVVLEVDPARL